ncbi:MAG: MBL fold metallo-hydrolase [gamma proteobacterium symbiont of Bathyaustriella thionipta]|nr:MBL fold metallo-hydrolase [gamma proteobacterium symbiont of Bathyaustriella thionipta]MCU7968361.1 MBL fold metallo-hydrolase [gamma proteobacterium symbiont of Bathyaustriella thionipta]
MQKYDGFKISLMISFFLMVSVSAYAWDLGKAGTFQFEKVNENVYVMHGPLSEPSAENQGFMNNPGLIVSGNGLIVIDPGSAYQVGQQVLNEIKKVSNKPVLAVFNTHIHGDHWLGNQAIKEKYPDAKIYGHPDMIKQANGEQGLIWVDMMLRLTEGKTKGTKVVAPELSVNQGAEIEVDGQTFRVHSMIPAHTNTDIMIEHVQSKTLFLGDNSFYKRMGRFDGSASMLGNIKALEYATELKMDTYVPGHGRTGKSDTAIKPFLGYLIKVQEVVQIGFDDELQDFEIKEKVIAQFADYQQWHGFDTNFGKHINSMYLEIENIAW